jgi:hypothetical protein
VCKAVGVNIKFHKYLTPDKLSKNNHKKVCEILHRHPRVRNRTHVAERKFVYGQVHQ